MYAAVNNEVDGKTHLSIGLVLKACYAWITFS